MVCAQAESVGQALPRDGAAGHDPRPPPSPREALEALEVLEGPWPYKCVPGFFGVLWLQDIPEDVEAKLYSAKLFLMFRGSPRVNKRASLAYLVVGLVLIGVSLWGFAPAIYWRLRTGTWWRDPVNIRTLPLLPGLDAVVSMHGVAGMAWMGFITLQLVTGAACSGPSDTRTRLRALHRFLGAWSPPLAYFFFATCGGTLLCGLVSEPIGQDWNSLFVRAVQSSAVALAFILYALGLYQGTGRNYALHKDCMIGSMLFVLVPTGVPRFGRDLVQWLVGSECNVSNTPEIWFFMCCVYCIVGWPALFMSTGRYWDHRAFPTLLRINAVLLTAFVALFRPSLRVEPCLWDAIAGGS